MNIRTEEQGVQFEGRHARILCVFM